MTNALARLEHLRSNPVEQPQPKSDPGRSSMDNLIDQLDHLAPPSKLPIDQEGGKPVPKGTSKTLPRGTYESQLHCWFVSVVLFIVVLLQLHAV